MVASDTAGASAGVEATSQNRPFCASVKVAELIQGAATPSDSRRVCNVNKGRERRAGQC